MASKLSMDVLSIIFEDVEQENDKTLYSCILVNRKWCQVAVPFLWKNPWKKINNNNNQANQYKILFKCFLMMMSKESKDFLKTNGINFIIEVTPFQNNFLQTPLFNYASFCKVIDSFAIYDMICYSIKDNNLKISIQDYHEYLVKQEILKLLICNTSKLKSLILSNTSHPIESYPNSSTSLSQLNELHCNTSIDATIFYGLSQLCRNIERLVIEGYNDNNHGLILFIKRQMNLKRVKIWEKKRDNFRCSAQGRCNNLGEALTTKSSSIIELDLGQYVITIPPLSLKNFQNTLTIFKFAIQYDLTDKILVNEFENVLKNISLPNLQQLIIYDNYCPFSIITKIIEKTNGELKKINIGTDFYEIEGADMLISAIAEHCPKLELLAVWVDNLDEILELIKECKKLRGLVLRSIYFQDVIRLFKVLYNDSSNQLRKLQLDSGWNISKKDLNEFFENWKRQQRNSLDFYIFSFIFQLEHEYIIKKYQKLGVVRRYNKYTGTRNYLDSWD